MSKLVYFIVPLGILFSGITLINTQDSDQPNHLKHISNHLSVLKQEAPTEVNFCGNRVPLENYRVKTRLDRELEKKINASHSLMVTLKKSYRYQERFKQILKQQGIPEDFFYLAIAESGLANLTSRVGAQGFWQFMEPTAKYYGLEISSTIDERFHPEKATYAACKYLKDDYKQLGDWALVAAAYNMGFPRVKKAMKNQKVNNYFDLNLNSETSAYLYRILAYKCLLSNPGRYGLAVNRAHFYKPIPYYSVRVSENIEDLRTFAEEKGSTYRMLKIMNPWLISDQLIAKEGKVYEIRFPLVDDIRADELIVEQVAPQNLFDDKLVAMNHPLDPAGNSNPSVENE